MNVRPLHDWLVVKLDARPEEEKVRGIILLGSAVERVWTGTVVRLGSGRYERGRHIPIDLREGQRVAFFRENFETSQGKQVAHILEDVAPGHGLLREDSILYKWET